MKRTPLHRKTRIKPVSDKMRAKRDQRSAWRESVFLRDRDRCRLCGKKATDAHHILYRSQGGPDTLDNGVALCRACHELVHKEGGRTWRPRLFGLVAGLPGVAPSDGPRMGPPASPRGHAAPAAGRPARDGAEDPEETLRRLGEIRDLLRSSRDPE